MNMSKHKGKAEKSLYQTVMKMVPAVLTALISTALGFIALYTSPVPMIKDFGKMLTLGMAVSFIVGVFILIPVLFTRDHFFHSRKNENSAKNNRGTAEIILSSLTQKLLTFRWSIIIIAFLTAGLGIWVDLEAGAETDVENFMPQDTQELEDIQRLREILGTTDQISIIYEADNVTKEEVILWVDHITQSLSEDYPETIVGSRSITSALRQMNEGKLPQQESLDIQINDMPENQRKLLINETQTKGVIAVGIKHLEGEPLKGFLERLDDYLERKGVNGIETTVTGKAVLDAEMVIALTSGRYKMTLLGMGLVFVGLLAIYRHPVKAFLPLLPIILIVGWSGGAMHMMGMEYTPLTATLGALIIGIGTEFTILIMERYFEERKKGRASRMAIGIANQKAGKAIFASAFTTIGGFSALLISDFVILSNFGLMTLINISLALISTMIVMPAILIILDRFVKIKHEDKNVEAANAG